MFFITHICAPPLFPITPAISVVAPEILSKTKDGVHLPVDVYVSISGVRGGKGCVCVGGRTRVYKGGTR